MQSLEPIAFEYLGDGCTGVTLVSEGAECVLINRSFFVKHITDAYMKFLRASVSTLLSKTILHDTLLLIKNVA